MLFCERLCDEYKCIIEHPGFMSNCLDIYVLEASVYEFVQDNGPLGDDEDIYRYKFVSFESIRIEALPKLELLPRTCDLFTFDP